MQLTICRPTAADVAPFGTLLTPHTEDGFAVSYRDANAPGWQLAYNRVFSGPVEYLGRHPDTTECFASFQGRAALIVAPFENPERMVAFSLEEPIVLKADVWHALVAIDDVAVAFIAENAIVSGIKHHLSEPVSVRLP